ncbi:MAG: Hsp20/alpha crystallin family protein [Halodesulfurarchaeum sp.]
MTFKGRSNPFEEIQRMLDRMSEQFEDVDTLRDFEPALPGRLRVDVEDYGDEFQVTADLPGFTKSDLDVELSENRLRIAAEHEEESESEEPERYVRRERRTQSVSRTITLPEEVDDEGVEATFRNGVLTVTLPKLVAEEDTHQIDIE